MYVRSLLLIYLLKQRNILAFQFSKVLNIRQITSLDTTSA